MPSRRMAPGITPTVTFGQTNQPSHEETDQLVLKPGSDGQVPALATASLMPFGI